MGEKAKAVISVCLPCPLDLSSLPLQRVFIVLSEPNGKSWKVKSWLNLYFIFTFFFFFQRTKLGKILLLPVFLSSLSHGLPAQSSLSTWFLIFVFLFKEEIFNFRASAFVAVANNHPTPHITKLGPFLSGCFCEYGT